MLNNIGEARRSYESSTPSGKFTQEDAARYFGVSVGTYAHWEQGKGKLNGEILCAIADKYGCSTDYLLCRTNDPAPYRPVDAGISLSENEKNLLDSYRGLNEEGQEVAVNTVAGLQLAYKKRDQHQVAKTA